MVEKVTLTISFSYVILLLVFCLCQTGLRGSFSFILEAAMRTIFSAIVISLSALLVACATTATPSPSSSGALEAVSAISPRAVTDAEKAKVLQEGKVLFREISGFWMGSATGQLSDFALTDVRAQDGVFVGNFFVKSTGRLDCSINRQVFGLINKATKTLEFVMEGDIACIQSFLYRARFNLSEKKGEYLTGRKKLVGGLFIVKTID